MFQLVGSAGISFSRWPCLSGAFPSIPLHGAATRRPHVDQRKGFVGRRSTSVVLSLGANDATASPEYQKLEGAQVSDHVGCFGGPHVWQSGTVENLLRSFETVFCIRSHILTRLTSFRCIWYQHNKLWTLPVCGALTKGSCWYLPARWADLSASKRSSSIGSKGASPNDELAICALLCCKITRTTAKHVWCRELARELAKYAKPELDSVGKPLKPLLLRFHSWGSMLLAHARHLEGGTKAAWLPRPRDMHKFRPPQAPSSFLFLWAPRKEAWISPN
jgi:hypothetical protein